MSKLPISCYIIAQNEGDRIGLTIQSIRDLVDEVIVVDSGSTDDTVTVSAALGARVMHNAWPGYGFQKRFAEDQCKHHWLLNLDADEEMTPQILTEISGLFANGEPEEAGFIFKIRDLLPGEKKLAPFAHTDFRIRLYNRNRGRVEASPSYDPVIVEQGEVKTLQAPVLHRSIRNLSHMIAKINNYSDVQVKALAKKGMTLPYVRLLIEYPIAFFKAYILRAYILRGWIGFTYSVIYAHGRFVRIAKYIELKNQSR